MDSDEKIRAGNEARMLLENPLVKDFMQNHIQKLFVKWLKATTLEERERLWSEGQVAGEFRQHFQNFITSGRIEERKHGEQSGTDGTAGTTRSPVI